MKLSRLKFFISEFEQRKISILGISSFYVFRKYNGKWFDQEDSVVDEIGFIEKFDSTLEKATHWRERKSRETYFPIIEHDAVMVVVSSYPPIKRTREKIHAIIHESLKYGRDAFFAAYDSLTGLRNSRSFEETTMSIIDDCLNRNSGTTGSLTDSSINSSIELLEMSFVAILEIDIDYFKQINDSYGHDYGDVVLKLFACRLENITKEIEQKYNNNLYLELGRCGGEEFKITVYGDISSELLTDISEEIRKRIADEELPSNQEWASIPETQKSQSLILPHVSERKVTVSIGISSIEMPLSLDNTSSISNELQREADAALYRAKSGGRDTCRHFPEIRDKYGAVLEHHTDTNIVVIDLGSQFNVAPGHEFLVYHPDFTGDKPFIYSDGRTKKRLGLYPRQSCGQIIVFDVQKEISFCQISENRNNIPFPTGSLLEFIPIGSITHLISTPQKSVAIGTSKLSQPSEIEEFVSNEVDKNRYPLVAIFTIDDISELERAKGIAFVNYALASLYGSIREFFSSLERIAQIQTDKFAVAGSVNLTDEKAITEILLKILALAEQKCSQLAKFGVGAYKKYAPSEPLKGDESNLNHKKALDYALYATPKEVRGDQRVNFFTPVVARIFIQNLRSKRKFKEALIDYKNFKSLGINHAYLENVAALCAFEMEKPDFDFALTCINQAVTLSEDKVLKANQAIINAAMSNWTDTYNIFKEIERSGDSIANISKVYLSSYAWAAYKTFIDGNSSVTVEELELLLNAAKTIQPLRQIPFTQEDIIKAAEHLKSLKDIKAQLNIE